MSEEPAVLVDIKDAVAEVTLNRPERMNTWGADMADGVFGALRELDLDDAVRAIIVTGRGDAFCAGADLSRRRSEGTRDAGSDSAPPAASQPPAATREPGPRPARVPAIYGWQVRKPVIAAINGAAVGVGMTLPLTFDIRIAALDAKLGFVFVSRGLVPELGSTWILPRLIGISRASEQLARAQYESIM